MEEETRPEEIREETEALQISEEAEEAADDKGEEAAQGEESQVEEEFPKDISLRYRISKEDYFQFQLAMGGDQVERNRKRNRILGWVELVLGVIYLGVCLFSGGGISAMQVVLSLILVGMGLYGILYFKYFFEGQLRKHSARQYDGNSYFQNDVLVDFYPNKCVEMLRDSDGELKPFENYWHSIHGVKTNDRFIMIMLEEKRCLLIPKEQIKGQLPQVESYLDRICELFEKKRVVQ